MQKSRRGDRGPGTGWSVGEGGDKMIASLTLNESVERAKKLGLRIENPLSMELLGQNPVAQFLAPDLRD